MSVSRHARCLFCRFSRPAHTVPSLGRRQFHAFPARYNQDDSNDASKEQPKKSIRDIERDMKPEHFKPYTQQEKDHLRKIYSPEQMAAVEAGEDAIDPKDLAEQFAFERGPARHTYVDDYSTIEPGVDKHVRAPQSNSDYRVQLKSGEDFTEDFGRFFAQLPENFGVADWVRFIEGVQVTKNRPESELNAHSSLVPDFLQPGESIDRETQPPPPLLEPKQTGTPRQRVEGNMRDFYMNTGFNELETKKLIIRTLVNHGVHNQTRLGKVRRAYVLVIAGNGHGMLGYGEGKAIEYMEAFQQAKERAIKNMQPVIRYENRTIFGDVKGKVSGTELELMNRPPGFGLRCQHHIFEICRAVGIHDLAARVGRSRNPMNTVKATLQALMKQRNPEDVARARSRKLVDVRKVYYAGRAA